MPAHPRLKRWRDLTSWQKVWRCLTGTYQIFPRRARGWTKGGWFE